MIIVFRAKKKKEKEKNGLVGIPDPFSLSPPFSQRGIIL